MRNEGSAPRICSDLFERYQISILVRQRSPLTAKFTSGVFGIFGFAVMSDVTPTGRPMAQVPS